MKNKTSEILVFSQLISHLAILSILCVAGFISISNRDLDILIDLYKIGFGLIICNTIFQIDKVYYFYGISFLICSLLNYFSLAFMQIG